MKPEKVIQIRVMIERAIERGQIKRPPPLSDDAVVAMYQRRARSREARRHRLFVTHLTTPADGYSSFLVL